MSSKAKAKEKEVTEIIHLYEGKRNETEFPYFTSLVKMDQAKMKLYLGAVLLRYYENVVLEDGFIYAKGTCPILLTAHMDTVHEKTVKDFYELKFFNEKAQREEHKISSPQGIGGDDRCGIYMILQVLKQTTFRPTILFCEDEEIGGVGSEKFCKHEEFVKEISELKYFIELDRANAHDAVYYNCGNEEFMEYVEKFGFKESYGSFSDISNLSPETDKASVNLSCGYYGAHTLQEYVIMEEMNDTIEKVISMLTDAENAESYDYQEVYYGKYYRDYYNYSYGYGYWKDKDKYKSSDYGFQISYLTKDHEVEYAYYDDNGEDDCAILGRFMMDNPTVCYNDVIAFEYV